VAVCYMPACLASHRAPGCASRSSGYGPAPARLAAPPPHPCSPNPDHACAGRGCRTRRSAASCRS
jgi:hypothetical protein